MKKIYTDELKVGDWICDSSNIKKGKFNIGKVGGYAIIEFTKFDMEKGEVRDCSVGNLTGLGTIIRLTKAEVKKLLLLKKKIKIIDGLI